MAWANAEDVRAILPEEEDDIPTSGHVLERLQVNLEEATDVVQPFLGRDYTGDDDDDDGVPDDVPPAVRRVVARVALRGFSDDAAESGATGTTNTMGPFAYHINWSKEAQSGDFYLTDWDELRLKPFRLISTRAAGHAPMAGSCGAWWA